VGRSFAKRFPIGGVTRDKEYPVTQGTKGSEVLYLSVNPNGEAEGGHGALARHAVAEEAAV